MTVRSACRAALLALLVAAPASAAQRPGISQFDVTRSQSWADALALCDLTTFLTSRPSLDAQVILSADGGSQQPLHGPRFIPPSMFYDKRVRLSFERLEKAGEIDRRSFAAARARHDLGLFRSYERASTRDIAFLEEQSRLCGALAADIQHRYR